jgi:predicted site-specific integrase-resolvase
MQPKLMNVRDTARYLQVSEATVRNWANRGVLHPLRLPSSGFRRFERRQVEQIRKQMAPSMKPKAAVTGSWLRARVSQYRKTLDYLHDH